MKFRLLMLTPTFARNFKAPPALCTVVSDSPSDMSWDHLERNFTLMMLGKD